MSGLGDFLRDDVGALSCMRLAVAVVVAAVVGVWVAGNIKSGSYVPLGQHEAEVLMAALGGKALQGFFEYGRQP